MSVTADDVSVTLDTQITIVVNSGESSIEGLSQIQIPTTTQQRLTLTAKFSGTHHINPISLPSPQ
jgi:hypothetical protein